VQRDERNAQAASTAEERSFGLDLWAEGVEYLVDWTTELSEIAGAILRVALR